MSFFSSFYKPAKKLFEEDYQKDYLSFNSKTSQGPVKYDFALKKEKKDSSKLAGELKWTESTKVQDFGVKVGGSLSNESDVKGDVNVNFGNGAELVVKGALFSEQKEDKQNNVEGEIQYSHKFFNGTFGAKGELSTGKVSVTASGLSKYENVTVGGSLKVEPKVSYKPKEWNAGIGYQYEDTQVLAQLEKSWKKFSFAGIQKVSKNVEGGFQYVHDYEKKKNEFAFGSQIKVDDDQTVKVKIDGEQNVAVSYLVNLNKNLKANVTLNTNLETLQGKATTSNVNVGFTFTQ